MSATNVRGAYAGLAITAALICTPLVQGSEEFAPEWRFGSGATTSAREVFANESGTLILVTINQVLVLDSQTGIVKRRMEVYEPSSGKAVGLTAYAVSAGGGAMLVVDALGIHVALNIARGIGFQLDGILENDSVTSFLHVPDENLLLVRIEGRAINEQFIMGYDDVSGRLLWRVDTDPGRGGTHLNLDRLVLKRLGSLAVLERAGDGQIWTFDGHGVIGRTKPIGRVVAAASDSISNYATIEEISIAGIPQRIVVLRDSLLAPTIVLHPGIQAHRAAFADQGRILILTSPDAQESWDLSSTPPSQIRSANFPSSEFCDNCVQGAQRSPNVFIVDRRLDGYAVLWNSRTGEVLGRIATSHLGGMTLTALAPDTVSFSNVQDGQLSHWRIGAEPRSSKGNEFQTCPDEDVQHARLRLPVDERGVVWAELVEPRESIFFRGIPPYMVREVPRIEGAPSIELNESNRHEGRVQISVLRKSSPDIHVENCWISRGLVQPLYDVEHIGSAVVVMGITALAGFTNRRRKPDG